MLYLFSHSFQLLSFFFSSMISKSVVIFKWQSSLTLSKIRLAILKYSIMFEYNVLIKWEFSLTLASFFLLTYNLSVKLTSKKTIKTIRNCKYLTSIQTLPKLFFDRFCTAQIAKLLPDNDIIGYVICLANITNKTNIDLFSMKCK